MPDHNRKPLSATGLTVTNRNRTMYPVQLGVPDPSAPYTRAYIWPFGLTKMQMFSWYAARFNKISPPARARIKPLLAKTGEYAWIWQSNRDMNVTNVGLVIENTSGVKSLLLKTNKHVAAKDRLIRITKKQYLEVLQRAKAGRALRRMGIVK